jgi:hypothetical protein
MDTYNLIRDPFKAQLKGSILTTTKEEQLTDLSSATFPITKFPTKSLPQFWIGVHNEYKELSAKAMKILIPFAASYVCETGLSAVDTIRANTNHE